MDFAPGMRERGLRDDSYISGLEQLVKGLLRRERLGRSRHGARRSRSYLDKLR